MSRSLRDVLTGLHIKAARNSASAVNRAAEDGARAGRMVQAAEKIEAGRADIVAATARVALKHNAVVPALRKRARPSMQAAQDIVGGWYPKVILLKLSLWIKIGLIYLLRLLALWIAIALAIALIRYAVVG